MWQYEIVNGKKTKVPYQADRRKAASNNPKTWDTFDNCVKVADKFSGIGIMCANELAGVDLDHCIDDAENVTNWARHIVGAMNTYTEITPSGEGLRCLFWGKLPEGARQKKIGQGKIEMYDTARFFTVTGNHFDGTPLTVERRAAQAAQIHAEYIGAHRENESPKPLARIPPNLDDVAIVEKAHKASNGDKFSRLWAGDLTDHNGDHSAADLALCSNLAFWTGNDAARIDGLFRRSGLMRPKWDEIHSSDRRTYGTMTIEKAISGTREVYTPIPPLVLSSDTIAPPAAATSKDDSTTWLAVRDVMGAFGRGETGDSELFAKLFTDHVCYDHSEKSWYRWNGNSWERDSKNSVVSCVANEVASQYLFCAAQKKRKGGEGANELAQKLQARAGSLRFKSKISNVLSLASSQKQIALGGDEWDADSMLLAVSNGVLNLRTGELAPGNPRDYIRTVSPVEWRGINEPCPRWEKFLSEIFAGDAEIVSFVRRWFGYCLTGDVSENSFVVLFGESGRNGKRILTETISRVLGAYAMAGDEDILLDSKDRAAGAPKQYLVDLAKRRFVLLSETKEGSRFHLARLKALSGGDTISARAAFGARGQQIAPTWKIILQTNRMPHADPDDEAFFERIFIIPFTQRFVVNPNPHDPNEHPRDTKLETTLCAESSGILAWLVRGCLEWRAQGLNAPDSIRNATALYREGEDLIGRFVAEKCLTNPTAQVRASELYDAYKAWCVTGNLLPMNGTAFGKRMGKRFKKRESHGIFYTGIGLLQT